MLVGGQGGGRGSLVTTDQFKDFELELEFMLAEHGTECSAELDRREAGERQQGRDRASTTAASAFRTGYQLNIGRREAGEFIGIVVHRKAPGAIRGNVLWLDTGDEKFPTCARSRTWNRLQHQRQGPATSRDPQRHEDLPI